FVDDSFRKVLGKLVHLGFDEVGRFERVGIRQHEDRQTHGRLAVEAVADVFAFGAHYDAAHVADADFAAVRLGPQHDFREFFRLDQPPFDGERNLHQLTVGGGRPADLTQGDLHVLLAHGGDDVGDGEIPGGKFVRIEPDPHAVVALAEDGHVA